MLRIYPRGVGALFWASVLALAAVCAAALIARVDDAVSGAVVVQVAGPGGAPPRFVAWMPPRARSLEIGARLTLTVRDAGELVGVLDGWGAEEAGPLPPGEDASAIARGRVECAAAAGCDLARLRDGARGRAGAILGQRSLLGLVTPLGLE